MLLGYGVVAFAVLQVVEPIQHALGLPDSLLKIVAQRLRRAIPGIETIARLGGDEFAILISLPDGSHETAGETGPVGEVHDLESDHR